MFQHLANLSKALTLITIAVFRKAKFQKVVIEALGHLATDIELHHHLNKRRGLHELFFIPIGHPAHKKLFALLSIKYNIVEIEVVPTLDLLLKLPLLRRLRSNSSFTLEDFSILDSIPSPISADSLLLEPALKRLEAHGYKRLQKIVCICVRDSGFDLLRHSEEVARELSYRNSDFELFHESIRMLLEYGYFVVRMGTNTINYPWIPTSGFYDYSSSGLYDEDFELAVFYLSSFTISTEFGVDELSTIFRKPVALINHLPISAARLSRLRPFSMPKILSKHGRILSLMEIISQNLLDVWGSSNYESLDVSVRNNESMEIRNAVFEFMGFLGETECTEVIGNPEAENLIYPSRNSLPKISRHWYPGKIP